MSLKNFITKDGLKFTVFDIKEVKNTISYVYNRDIISKSEIQLIIDFLNKNSEEKNIIIYKIEGTIDTFAPDLNFYKNFVKNEIQNYQKIIDTLEYLLKVKKNKENKEKIGDFDFDINFDIDFDFYFNKYEYEIFRNKINKFIVILKIIYKKLLIIETSFQIFDNP